MATITIDVLNFSLATTGSGPIKSAYDVQFDEPLSQCGIFSFKVPCRDTKSALLLTQQSVFRIYADTSPVFLGIVESKERSIDASGIAYFDVSGRSFLAELSDQSVGFLNLESASAAVSNGPALVLSATSPSSLTTTWAIDSTAPSYTTTTRDVYARFRCENRLSALVKISEKIGEHFIYRPQLSGVDREIMWLRSFSDSGVRAIQQGGEAVALEGNDAISLITSLSELEDGYDIVNRILPFGAGDDLENSAFTIAATAYPTTVGTLGQPDYFIVRPTDSTGIIDWYYSSTTLGYRQREQVVQFQDIAPVSNTDADQIAAADMLAEAAMRYLERYGIPRKFYELEVTKLPSTVTPGQTIRVVYYEVDADGNTIHDINDDLNILNIATNYGNDGNDGSVIYKLTVSDTDRFPMNDAEEMAQRIEQGQVYQSYTQLSSNSDTISHVEDFDTSTSISFPFWMGAEIAQVNQVLLRFRVDPLRSTVASSAAGSSHTHSVTINSHTHTIPGHSHTLTVPHTGSVAGDVGVVSSSQGLWYTGTDVGDWSILTDSGTGGTTSDSGGSSTPTSASESSHTHALTYGVYEDSGTGVPRVDTIAHLLEDVTIEVNNVAIVAGDLTLTGRYFVLDLTALESGGSRIVVTEDTFRPVSVYNTITVQGNFVSPDNHQGRFTGQLLIRSLVQATANI
jgi:hypothetical protein